MPEPLFHEVYDSLFAAKDYRHEVLTGLNLGGVSPPDRILEIGSGTGNHSLACAELGFGVVGVEIDEHMVEIARRKLLLAEPAIARRIEYFHGRACELPLEGFAMALSLFNVVNYCASGAELGAFMDGIANRLRTGASFVFDAWNGDAALKDPPRAKTTVNDKMIARLECETDAAMRVSVLTYRISTTDGRKGEHVIRHSLWSPGTLREAAAASGFDVLAVMPTSNAMRPATDEDWKLLFHCRRSRIAA